jgi:hypothetical protein
MPSVFRGASATIIGVIPDPIDVGDNIVDTVDWNDVLSVWLQPLATVITGLLAVLAAAVAYRAVTRQIKANAENVQKQIDANALAVSAQIAADRSERRRAERIDLATDGVTLVTDLAQIAFNHEQGARIQQLEFEKYELAVLATSRRMWLLGMPKSSEAVEAVYKQARIVINPLPSDEPAAASTVEQKRDKALSTLKASLEQEVTPAQISQGGQ